MFFSFVINDVENVAAAAAGIGVITFVFLVLLLLFWLVVSLLLFRYLGEATVADIIAVADFLFMFL